MLRGSLLASLPTALALGLVAAAPLRAGSITGVCPDGSMFVVQQASSIPCRDAKLVQPHEVPPMRPEFLPRPYGWDVFQRETNPNNPYNQVITRGAPPETSPAPQASPTPQVSAAPPKTAESPAPTPVAVASAPPQSAANAFAVSL